MQTPSTKPRREFDYEALIATPAANDVERGSPDPAANLELVRRIAGALVRHLPAHVELAELVALGNLGLVEASRRWDPSRGVPFAAFAAMRIRGAMLDGLRGVDPLTREERAQVRRDDQEAPVVLVHLTAATDRPAAGVAADEQLEECGRRDEVQRALRRLPERQRLILTQHFLDEQPLKSIGEALGVTESRICQIVAEALKRLRGELGMAGGEVIPIGRARKRRVAVRSGNSERRVARAEVG